MNEIHENLTHEQKIDLLKHDFLDRDGDSFVKIRRTGRLDWESTLPEEGAYSDFMLHPESMEDLIKNAYNLANDMITVMDTPFKVNVRISDDSSCTDSNTVWVATKMFDDNDLSIGHRLDTFIGLAVHEGCHLLYTDFKAMNNIHDRLIGALQNIIEDERIERLCGENKPGLANFLKATKYYYFDKYRQDMKKLGTEPELDSFTRLFNCILAMVRYPKAMEESDMDEFADVLLEVRDVLSDYPTNTQEAIAAAMEIRNILMQFMKEQLQKQAGGAGESGDPSEENDGNEGNSGNEGSQGNDGNQDSDVSSGDSDSNGNRNESSEGCKGKARSGKKGKKSSASEHQDSSVTAKDVLDRMSEAVDRMKDALENIVNEPGKKGLDDSQQSDTLKDSFNIVAKICEGSLERGTQKDTYVQKGIERKDVYMDSYNRIKKHIPAIEKMLRCSSQEYKLIYRGMRTGVLDTGKIAEAYQGVPTVYMREGEVRSDRIAVCILIDESGSMWGEGDIPARDTAVLLNEALGRLNNVDLFIYGHSTIYSSTELFVYRERGFRSRYALGSTDARAGNNDSIAIREAAARVRRFTSENVLFFMISDGAPTEDPRFVRKAVSDVEKQGFKLVAISIEPHYDPSLMYPRNVNLSDMNTLAVELGKLVKKAIMSETAKKVV